MNHHEPDSSLEFREVRVEDVLELRHEVLRPDRPPQQAEYRGDRETTTHHFAAFRGREEVACVTFQAAQWDGQPSWQVRGLATRAAYRRHGIAHALLDFAQHALRSLSPARLLWCNATAEAAPFYEKEGWQVAPEEHLLEENGSYCKQMD